MSVKPTREQLQTKIDRAHAARIKAEQFIDAGGDLDSKDAVPIGMELSLAANELSSDFGQPFLKDPPVPENTHQDPNAETISRLVARASFLLNAYHAECNKSAASRETEFWRGNLSGFRYVVGEICGQDIIHEALENARKNTGLEIPPKGVLDSDGKFLGADSDAGF
jgi:hypothetical protein